MVGEQLDLTTVINILDDAAAAGCTTVRLYGGEPLIHPHLAPMVEHACHLGILPYITTNGFLLKEKISALYAAGLRVATIGLYASGQRYDTYVGVENGYSRFERGLAFVKDKYGSDFRIQLNYLLMRETCSVETLHRAWDLAVRYDASLQIDLIHYSLPYFTEGPNRELQFRQEDKDSIREFTRELLALKTADPQRIPEPVTSIKSIPDWLLLGPDMRIPCDAYNMIWIGADGSVQLCYAAFPLGNVHTMRLKDVLFSARHRAAAQGAFKVECQNCHCERSTRIAKHLPSQFRYSGQFV
jgi:cyclic pyranopterin phosphate synthase